MTQNIATVASKPNYNLCKGVEKFATTFYGGKKILKFTDLTGKWIKCFYSSSKVDKWTDGTSLANKFSVFPSFIKNSAVFINSIQKNNVKELEKSSIGLVKDSYKIYTLGEKLALYGAILWTRFIGYGLLIGKTVTSISEFKKSVEDIEKFNLQIEKRKSFPKQITSLNEKINISKLNIIDSICWISTGVFSMIVLIFSYYPVYLYPLFLTLNTLTFIVSVYRFFYIDSCSELTKSKYDQCK